MKHDHRNNLFFCYIFEIELLSMKPSLSYFVSIKAFTLMYKFTINK